MPAARTLTCLLLGWLLGAPLIIDAQEVIYIQPGSAWRWRPGSSEASEPQGAWRENGFDDSAWLSGQAPFGYGDPPFGTDLSKAEPPMRRNYSTLYLRHTLEIPNPALVVALEGDPATPATWAGRLADVLGAAVVVWSDAEGHGAYLAHSWCLTLPVTDYLVDLVVPEDGWSCEEPTWWVEG